MFAHANNIGAKMSNIIKLGFILSAGIIFAVGTALAAPRVDPIRFVHQETAPSDLFPPPEHQPSRAERVTRALVEAYPRRVERAEYRGGDWAVLLRGIWFYYAGGRMMPEHLLYRAEYYSPIAFHDNYPKELPPWSPPSYEQAERLLYMTINRATHIKPRAHYFFDTLYRAHDHDEAYQRVKTLRFLGHQVLVHHAILEELSLVEEKILAAARIDPQVRAWMNNIRTVEGWSWRTIAGTQTRSLHSYGIAIDLIPRVTGGREQFWRWAADRREDWWNIPHSGRYHPPQAVISAFESLGFIWGGKWLFFDTMHFEFRPEVFILNGIEMSTLR